MKIPQAIHTLTIALSLLTACGAQVTEPAIPATEPPATVTSPPSANEAEAAPMPAPPAVAEPVQLEEQMVLSSFSHPVTVQGETLILYGHVLDASGQPLSGYAVEIWQVDANGIYDHPGDSNTASRDMGFQFYGTALTDESGLFVFRTIVPARYEPRPRHIHFKVKKDGSEVLTSQFYFVGDVSAEQLGNGGELLLLDLRDTQDASGNAVKLAVKDILVNVGSGKGLTLTLPQLEGPYYPVADVAAFDNDLANVEQGQSASTQNKASEVVKPSGALFVFGDNNILKTCHEPYIVLMEVRVKDLLYRLLAECFQAFIWGGDVMGEENLPEQGPAVLVANHLAALGPMAVVACVPRRLHPWVHAEVMDPELAPEYLRWDFIEKELHLPMPFSLWLAKAISKISVPLLNQTGCIPVHTSPEGLYATFDQSVNLLSQGRYIVVFPEDPTQPPDPQFGMSPFKKGFVRLGEIHFQRTGRSLRFYPLAVHAGRRSVQVGGPVTYNPYALPARERLRVKHALENMIREMLIGKDGNFYLRVPLPH